jgi:Uri superfamily endonuclease
MSKRYVTLPNGKSCGLGKYVSAWRKLRTIDPDTSMHDRINRHLSGYGKGRKWHHDWQRAAIQTAYAVNTPRLIVRWVPWDLRHRLAHRITRED